MPPAVVNPRNAATQVNPVLIEVIRIYLQRAQMARQSLFL